MLKYVQVFIVTAFLLAGVEARASVPAGAMAPEAVASAGAAEQWRLVPEKSRVTFFVRTTLHDFLGKATTLSGSFENDSRAAKGAVDVDVAGLKTDNQGRDANMYRMFNEPLYKQIHFAIDQMDIAKALENKADGPIAITGVMTIHNISRPVALTANGHWEGAALVCDGDMNIHLKDYDLRPPSVLFMIRVADLVNVKYSMLFAR